MNMFTQHYLENKKPAFPTNIPKQVFVAILKSSKNSNPLQKRQTYS